MCSAGVDAAKQSRALASCLGLPVGPQCVKLVGHLFLADADQVITRRTNLWPRKLWIVFRRLSFHQHGIKLGHHTRKGSGGGFGQCLEQILRSVGCLTLRTQCRRIANFAIGGIPTRLMGGKIGFSLRAFCNVFRAKIEHFAKRLK
ncbi:hypothetical protein MPLB_1880024 [Mesorhizobium sp. ORS 3324]|nr:hypothetical protein MPLB_1880024 [Mesorhizobium sp. ORS 3324]